MARVGILVASDKAARGEREDLGGATLEETLKAGGQDVVRRAVLPDDRAAIAAVLREWCDAGDLEVVITTGGTGLAERDVTPEATRDIAERDVPGIPLALAVEGLKHTPFAVLSRGVAVTRGRTLVVNLPGNPRAVAEGLAVLLPLIDHAARVLSAPLEHSTPADSGHAG